MEWSFIFTLVFSFLCSVLLIVVLLVIVFEVLFIKEKDYQDGRENKISRDD